MEWATHPAGHRLRRGRVSEPGRNYLITATCWDRHTLFRGFESGRAVVQGFREADDLAETWCFVVMPDHIHWLMQLRDGVSIGRAVGKVKARATLRLRNLHPDLAEARIWQPGFHDRALRRYEDLRPVARYVIANPLRAGLVERIGDYPLWDACWL